MFLNWIFLRAYASIWDFVNSILGTHIPSIPPQTYGFFLFLAFITGYMLARSEFIRKTLLGIFPTTYKNKVMDGKINWWDVAINSVFAGFIGLKFLGIINDFEAFKTSPQEYILSLEGSMIGGVMSIAFVISYYIYRHYKNPIKESKMVKQKITMENRLMDLLIIAMIGGILGSKIVDALDNPNSLRELIENPLVSLTSGLSILGGLWLVSILLIIYGYVNKIKLLPFVDSMAPAFFMAYGVGRLGCQFAGDGCWGIPTTGLTKPAFLPDFLWGNTYPHNVNNDGILIPNCTEAYCFVLPEPHLQTPIYETIIVTFLFSILWSLRKKWTFNYGAITGLFLIFNALERFFIEFIRVNHKYDYFGMQLTQSQFMSVIMFFIGLILLIYALNHKHQPEIQ